MIAPASDAPPPPFDDAPVPGDEGLRSFVSRPDLRPPAVDVVTATPDASTDPVFVAPKRGASAQGPLILDGQGQPLWFRPLSGDDQAFDFRRQTLGGKPVLTWWQGRVALYRGYGTGRIVDTRYRPVATVRMGNGYRMDAHEFQLTSRGTALAIAYEAVPWDLSKLGGRRDGIVEDNVVQEIDVDSGAVLFEWHALGTIPLAESIRTAPKQRGQPHDPFHLNAVTLDRDGNFIVSARHTSTIYKLDRDTGEILWRLGGKRSDYKLGPGAEFHLQHDARRRDDGAITLFDNVAEDLPARGRRSRGLALKLDDKAKTATVAQEFEHPGTVLSGTQGSMQSLDDGGAFVGWGGMQPWMTEFGADAAPDWDARFLAPKVESYRAYRLPWAGIGEGRPAAVVRGRRVYASWNGATGVASWRVDAGGRRARDRGADRVRDGDHAAAPGGVRARRGARRRRRGARPQRLGEVRPERQVELRHHAGEAADVVVQRRVQRRLELRPQRRGLRVGRAGGHPLERLAPQPPGHPEPPQQRAPAALGGRLEPARVERGVADAEERERAPVLGRPGPPGSARTAAPGSARDRRSGAAGRAGRRAGAGRRRRSCRRCRPRRARRAGRRRSRGSARSGRRPSRAASRPAPRGAAAAASRRRTCSGPSTRRTRCRGGAGSGRGRRRRRRRSAPARRTG